ncbi:MAG: hypothetical protein OXR66_01895 [Candidatus Woesearchaeota archaeon]|nr:hypothetical protein [Candidatus Woesearchaeota archaeon]
MADDYELVSQSEVEHLRKEVEQLKRNPLGDTHASVSLLGQLQELNKNIVSLLNVFKGANDDMLKAYHQGSVQEQLRQLRQENAKIAHGIVALSKSASTNPFSEPVVEQAPQEIPAQEIPAPPEMELSEEHLTEDLQNPFKHETQMTAPASAPLAVEPKAPNELAPDEPPPPKPPQ